MDFIRIVIVFFKYNTFYFTYPPRKQDFSHILPSCLLFIAESRKYHPVVVLLHNHKWLKKISRKVCRHFNGSPLLCPINATSSFPYVFRLQYPRVLHCRIVPIQKLTILFVFGRKNPPVNHLGSKYKTNHMKVTRNLRENFSWTHDRGEGYFHETFVRHHINLTKYILFTVYL